MRSRPAQQYLSDVVMKYEGDECLIWPFSRNPHGYALVQSDGRMRSTHRVVCEKLNGPPPSPDHVAAHSCGKGTSGCVTPKHLSWKTPAENLLDKVKHGNIPRGEQHARSKISIADVLEIKRLKGRRSQSDVAKMFGLSQPHVGSIMRGESWGWVKDDRS